MIMLEEASTAEAEKEWKAEDDINSFGANFKDEIQEEEDKLKTEVEDRSKAFMNVGGASMTKRSRLPNTQVRLQRRALLLLPKPRETESVSRIFLHRHLHQDLDFVFLKIPKLHQY